VGVCRFGSAPLLVRWPRLGGHVLERRARVEVVRCDSRRLPGRGAVAGSLSRQSSARRTPGASGGPGSGAGTNRSDGQGERFIRSVLEEQDGKAPQQSGRGGRGQVIDCPETFLELARLRLPGPLFDSLNPGKHSPHCEASSP